jgi:hypothetical protein
VKEGVTRRGRGRGSSEGERWATAIFYLKTKKGSKIKRSKKKFTGNNNVRGR